MTELVPLVAVDELPADLRAQWEATRRPGRLSPTTASSSSASSTNTKQ